MNLYNLRSTELGYRITKFTMDIEVEASYNLSKDKRECDCPAGFRPSCKHRKMIFRMFDHCDDNWFYCYETQKWHRPMDEDAGVRGEAEGMDEGSTNMPDGVTAISFDDPSLMHKVIGEAVGEAPPRPLVTRR